MDAKTSTLAADSLPKAIPNTSGWRADAAAGIQKSLPEVYGSVAIPLGGHWWRKMLAFAGPGYLVSVGYMDPGNWATDLEGGARFGYALIWVLLMSNLMAVILQTLSARLGVVTGHDLAQACRSEYSRPINFALPWRTSNHSAGAPSPPGQYCKLLPIRQVRRGNKWLRCRIFDAP